MKILLSTVIGLSINAAAAQEPKGHVVLTEDGVIIQDSPEVSRNQPALGRQMPQGTQKRPASGPKIITLPDNPGAVTPGPTQSPQSGRQQSPYGGNGGYGNKGGYSSSGWNRKKVNSDAVLSKRNRKISFDKKDNPQLATIDAYLIFGREEINVGNVTWGGNTGSVTVSKDLFKEISQKHTGEIARLNIKIGNDWYFQDDEEGVRVYVAATADEDCRYPVYLTDHDGTISSHDKCTTETIDQVIESKNGVFFVISSNGTSMKGKILEANYKNKDKILVLGKSSGGSWGATEKALRVFSYFSNSGACIAGFAGDTPTVDGEASKILNVPYFAVNQREEEETEVTHTTKEVCSLTSELRYSYEVTVYGEKGCAEGYNTMNERTEIECKRSWNVSPVITADSNNANPAADRSTYWVEKPGFLGIGGGPGCNFGDEATGKKRKAHQCRRNMAFEMVPDEKKQCAPGYNLEARQIMNRKVIGMRPSINILEFPEGSLWSKNWCDLGRSL